METPKQNQLIVEEKGSRQVQVLPESSPMGMMMMALNNGATLEQVEKMMDLQERWQKGESKKAFDAAFSAFKAEGIQIFKGKKVSDGPLKGKSYAELHDIVNAVTPALSKHGLSSSWRLTRDEKDWLEVTCYLRHVGGHEESVSMGGPPDTGGAKNAIQSRASAKTYLERYTLKAILGMSEQDDDNDGNGNIHADWLAAVESATTMQDLSEIKQDGEEAYKQARNVAGYAEFMKAVSVKAKQLKGN